MEKKISTAIYLMIFTQISLAQKIQQPTIISLGHRCWPAGALRNHHLRTAAFPFDWIISPVEAISNALKDDFKFFLADEFLKESDDNCAIVDYYGFEFRHDFTEPGSSNVSKDWKSNINKVREKYVRRIRRLIKALEGPGPILFIRCRNITQQQTIELYKLLTKKFPSSDISLAVIGETDDFAQNWGIKGIKNFYIKEDFFWNYPQWEIVFKDLQLI